MGVGKTAQGATGKTQGMGTAISSLGAAFVAAGAMMAAAKVAGYIHDVVDASSEQQEIFTALSTSLRNAGVDYKDVAADKNPYFSAQQESTVYGDTDSARVLDKLVSMTGDYQASLKGLPAILNAASGSHKDLITVTEAVGKAINGQIGGLSRLGIVFDDATKATLKNADEADRASIIYAELEKHFGGAAADQLETFGGKVEQLGNYWGDFEEAVGDAITKNEAVMEALD